MEVTRVRLLYTDKSDLQITCQPVPAWRPARRNWLPYPYLYIIVYQAVKHDSVQKMNTYFETIFKLSKHLRNNTGTPALQFRVYNITVTIGFVQWRIVQQFNCINNIHTFSVLKGLLTSSSVGSDLSPTNY